MTQYHVAYLDGSLRVYATELGIDRRYLGPIHETPRAAIAYSDRLQERATDEQARAGAPEPPAVAPGGGSRSDSPGSDAPGASYGVHRPLRARAKDPTAVGAAPRRGLVRSGSFAGSRERIQAGPPAQ